MISMTGHLDVVVPPTIIDEESSPSTVSVREKHNASLICKSHGVCSLPVSHQNKRTSHDLMTTESKGVCTIRCLNQTSPGEERTVDRSSETPTRRSRGRWRALSTGGNTLICRLTWTCINYVWDYIKTGKLVKMLNITYQFHHHPHHHYHHHHHHHHHDHHVRTSHENKWERTSASRATRSRPRSARGSPWSLSVSFVKHKINNKISFCFFSLDFFWLFCLFKTAGKFDIDRLDGCFCEEK